jgi:cytochrome P450
VLSGPFNRNSLFFAEGADWKWQRRAVAPAFRHDNLLALVPSFAQCARVQAEVWRKSAHAAPVDVMDAMSRTTFAVIERTALGEATSLDREKFLAELRLALASVSWRRMISLLNLPDWTPHPGYLKARAATAYLYNETVKTVAARRASGSDHPERANRSMSLSGAYIAMKNFGTNPPPSTRTVSPRKRSRGGIAAPICPSAPARAFASAWVSRCWR